MTHYFVVLIETAGNQRTIFQTNRQRESLGASELIHRVGTRYVLEALGREERLAEEIASDPARLDALLLDTAQNPPIEDGMDTNAAEIVIATSGKAILLVRRRARGEEIVAHVTRRASSRSPGVTARGALAPVEGGSAPTAEQLHDAIFKAYGRHVALAALLPSADARFPRLPFVEDCASSGLPAAPIWEKNEAGALAVPLAKRREAHEDARRRMCNALGTDRLTRRIQDLERKGYNWTAVVHADGNGLGSVFLNFAASAFKKPTAAGFRDYIARLRSFSIGIDQCTRAAARVALDDTWRPAAFKDDVPLIPIVLGGDDLTVICDGGKAIEFTVAFLRAFEEQTRKCADVTRVAGREGLSACAGIAIVKPHFPFHRAYELAEGLIKSAKTVKQKAKRGETPMPCSAFDFQIVFDTHVSDLGEIRARMTARDGSGASLTFRPYVVSDAARLEGLAGKDWLTQHHIDKLMESAGQLRNPADDDAARDGGLALPRSQQHVLRWALGEGKAVADARLNEIRHRYDLDWDKLAPGGSLFRAAEDGDRTYLLDAMDLADLEAAAVKGSPR